MQKVLVWKSYGDIQVYAADTAEQMEGIVNTVIACLKYWELNKEIKVIREYMIPGDVRSMVRAFATLRSLVVDSKHEQFEDIYLTNVQEKCQ